MLILMEVHIIFCVFMYDNFLHLCVNSTWSFGMRVYTNPIISFFQLVEEEIGLP